MRNLNVLEIFDLHWFGYTYYEIYHYAFSSPKLCFGLKLWYYFIGGRAIVGYVLLFSISIMEGHDMSYSPFS